MPRQPRRDWRLALGAIAGAAVLGISIFGALAWRAVSVRSADALQARVQFDGIRAQVSTTVPSSAPEQEWCWTKRARKATAFSPGHNEAAALLK